MSTSFRLIVAVATLALVAAPSIAQDAMTFRLERSDRNPASCSTADATMSRPQTVTIAGDVAILKSNGGINDRAKKAGTGLYRTKWALGGITYDIEVNTTASPPTLSVNELKIGCKWTGKAA